MRKNTESTPYQKIFRKFMRKITDFGLLTECEEMRNQELIGLLDSACDEYVLCEKDLDLRDDELMIFPFRLTSKEQSILSKYMVLEWIRPNVASIMDLKPILGDKDFETYSQANFLKEKRLLMESIKAETSFDMIGEDYHYDRITDLLG